ncbi:RHS repeat-associated core domain-containing protein [Pseudomonas sp. NFIX28]|uniref:RHS repeat-associated core domain-containing protein n=1 Tax=Pseudomonas sp. NFIX28 TaxID=1566235 RepID=UPI000899490D|nr:RHS repeat-associated core domain-containing protein [Pseudomonas sp. NFIX28]SDY38164.1 RHS repeat-associated core domain-containing protein [Pseudomonas sp. NFIX28]
MTTANNISTTAAFLVDSNTRGFNGFIHDCVSNTYLLGNGYRAYSPMLRTFYSPDSLSPFGAAGINRYQYCQLDPINYIDPTGHISWQAVGGTILGIVGTVAGVVLAIPTGGASLSLTALAIGVAAAGLGLSAIGTGIASAVYDARGDIKYAEQLGWISYGLGAASFAVGAGLGGGTANLLQGSGVLTTLTGSGLIFAGVASDSPALRGVGFAFTLAGIGMVLGGGILSKFPARALGMPRGLSYPPNQPGILSNIGLRSIQPGIRPGLSTGLI